MKFGRGHHRRPWGRRRVLTRWTPRALMRRTFIRMTKWGLRLMAWGVRRAMRRALRKLLPTALPYAVQGAL